MIIAEFQFQSYQNKQTKTSLSATPITAPRLAHIIIDRDKENEEDKENII